MEEACGGRVIARFKLHLRCENCVRDSVQMLAVPDGEDAPTTIDELLESALLERQRFFCRACESAIGLLMGVTPVSESQAA